MTRSVAYIGGLGMASALLAASLIAVPVIDHQPILRDKARTPKTEEQKLSRQQKRKMERAARKKTRGAR